MPLVTFSYLCVMMQADQQQGNNEAFEGKRKTPW